MRTLSTLLLLVLAASLSAQKYCGFDPLHALSHQHEGAQFAESELNRRIADRVFAHQTRDDEVLIIPVVVHIIHQGGAENIPDAQVQDAIDHLNDAFANAGFYNDNNGVTSNIEFCLASRDPDDNFTSGINRVESPLTDMLVPSQDADLKALSFWDSEHYLNIWVVEEITREPDNSGVVGYATFPDSHGLATDGIVCEAATFGASEVGSTVHVHECGHYLGLYHTFQDGCPNDDCLTSGDRVCDTPPDQDVYTVFCNDGTNSCDTDDDDLSTNNPFRPVSEGGIGDQLDYQTNFMDYSNLACFERFTEGQVERMRAAILEVRSSLLDGEQCTPPCSSPIDADVATSELNIEVGEEVSFVNLSTNFTTATWFIEGNSAGSPDPFVFEPATQGTYLVELVLTNEDPGCSQTLSWEVVVTCPTEASFTYTETQIPAGGTLTLENTSTGASNYTWYIDGIPTLATEDFEFTFDEPGGYSIYLQASGSTCTDQSTVLYITVGTCTSGNEANLWHHYNVAGDNFGIDFNQDPVGFIPENNLPVVAAHCKSGVCDPNGNLLALSTGVQAINREYEIMPNGDDLLGGNSSHYGTLFVGVPGNEDQFYLFTTAQDGQFNDGLRYHVIDMTMDGGLGDVIEKNVLVDVIDNEAFTAIRHCNLVDFWLLAYNQNEQKFFAWQVTEDGVSEDPVISNVSLDVSFSLPLTPSSRGNRLVYGGKVLDFDATTGTVTDELGMTQPEWCFGWELSANGRYLYLFAGEFTTEVYQVDLENFDPSDPLAGAYTYDLTGIPVYFYPQRGPDGNIYVEDVFTNNIARIENPNLPGPETTFVNEWNNAGALINSFGNFFHAYIAGKTIFIDGPSNVCKGQTVEYSIYGHACITDLVEWFPEGSVSWEELDNGVVEITFLNEGEVLLNAGLETACGSVTDALTITVGPESGLDLGEDFGQCTGGAEPLIDAGEGYNSYEWSTGETTQSIVPDGSGVFSVTVTTDHCTDTDEVTVSDELATPINLGADLDLCDGTVVLLNASTGYNDYTWQDGTTGPNYTVFEGGEYTVTATVPCFSTDTIFVDDCDQNVNGVEDEEASARLFPNPSSGQFTLDTGTAGLKRVVVVAADGKRVWEAEYQGQTRAELQLDVAPGTYTVTSVVDGAVLRNRVVIR